MTVTDNHSPAFDLPATGVILVTLAVACSAPDRRVTGDVPPNTYVAAIGHAGGVEVASTGLRAYTDGDALKIDLEGSLDVDRITVYAFDRAAIDSFPGRPSMEGLREMRLSVVSGREPPLPGLLWAGETAVGDGGGPLIPVAAPAALTADWLPRCPAILLDDEVGFLDEDCRPVPCGARVRQRGCELLVDVPLCTGGTLEGRLSGGGEASFETSREFGSCRSIPTREGARLSLRCSGGQYESELCNADVFGETLVPNDGVVSVRTGDGAAITDHTARGDRHTSGLVLFDDRVIVSRYDQPAGPSCEGVATTLQIRDPMTLELVDTATAPACLRVLRRVADTTTIVGLYAERNEHGVVLFDHDGRVIRRQPIVVRPSTVPVDVAVDPMVGEVLVLMTPARGTEPALGYLLRFDAATLMPIEDRPPIEFGRYPQSVGVHSDGSWVVVDVDEDQVFIIRDAEVARFTARARCGRTYFSVVREHHATGNYLITSRQDIQALLFFDTSGDLSCRRIKMFEYPAEPQAVADWPLDPDLAVVGFDGSAIAPRDASFIAFANVRHGHMEGGAIEVGSGPILEIAVDPTGRVYALLAWSDTLVMVPPQ